jgi:hypothetical protein
MTMSLIKPAELPFGGALFHHGFEALQGDDFPECHMDSFGP